MLNWSQADLAKNADVALTTVKRLEKGEPGTKVIVNALIAALAAGGATIASGPGDLDGLDVEGVVAKLRSAPSD